MKNRLIRNIALIFIGVIFMIAIWAAGAMAQTDTTTPNAGADLSSIINGLGLPQDKYEATLKLTKAFLTDLQTANQELTQLMSLQQVVPSSSLADSQVAGGQTTGSQLDSKTLEKITVVQRAFGIKLEQYSLDLGDTIGEENAAKIVEKIRQMTPQVLLQNSQIAAGNHSSHSGMQGMSGMTSPTPPVNGLNATGSNNTNTTQGMNTMPGTTMPGTTPNNNNGTGLDAVNQQILLQLQTSNSMLLQMLSIISNQSNSETLKAQLQPIYQLIASQSTLLQMLYANLNTSSTSSGSGSSSGSGMGNMGGMSGM